MRIRQKNRRGFETYRDEMKERTEKESRSKTWGGAFEEVAGESSTKAFGSSQEMCRVILGQAKTLLYTMLLCQDESMHKGWTEKRVH